MGIDQSGKDRLVAELDDVRSGGSGHMAITDFDDPAIVDKDGRGPERSLAWDGDDPPGMDVGRSGECGGSARNEGSSKDKAMEHASQLRAAVSERNGRRLHRAQGLSRVPPQ
jgi:hypothetical protein